jgi:hypothetical protein
MPSGSWTTQCACSLPAPAACRSACSTRDTVSCPFAPRRSLTGSFRRVFAGVRDDLAFEQAQGREGRVAATSDEDAGAIAHHILEVYLGLDRLLMR